MCRGRESNPQNLLILNQAALPICPPRHGGCVTPTRQQNASKWRFAAVIGRFLLRCRYTAQQKSDPWGRLRSVVRLTKTVRPGHRARTLASAPTRAQGATRDLAAQAGSHRASVGATLTGGRRTRCRRGWPLSGRDSSQDRGRQRKSTMNFGKWNLWCHQHPRFVLRGATGRPYCSSSCRILPPYAPFRLKALDFVRFCFAATERTVKWPSRSMAFGRSLFRCLRRAWNCRLQPRSRSRPKGTVTRRS